MLYKSACYLFFSIVTLNYFCVSIGFTQTVFSDSSAASGIDKSHDFSFLITGQSWGDYNQDGCPDLYLTDSTENTLYLNNCDGTFAISPLAGQVALSSSDNGGASFADYNNDGWLDLIVAANGTNTLFQNQSGTGFINVNVASGTANNSRRSETIVWGDYDSDGHLDIFVVNYNDVGTLASQDSLFHNNGDGSFTDVSGLLDPEKTQRSGFTARWLDYDNDGDLDLYVVNDKADGNPLWRNDGEGCGGWCFIDVSVATGAVRPVDGMGIAAGDYDNDGDLDLYFSSSNEAVLLQSQISQGNDQFIEVTDIAGVNFNAISWGTHFLDFDNDGWQDLYLSIFFQENRIFHNQGNTTFTDISATSGGAHSGGTIGSAVSDYNNDGALDIVIGGMNENYLLFQNVSSEAQNNQWLRIILEGSEDINRDAIGSRVFLTTDNGITQMQDVRSGNSIGSGSERVLHFGLGQHQISKLKIVWENGVIEVLDNISTNQTITHRFNEVFQVSGFED